MVDQLNIRILRTALATQARFEDRLRREDGQSFVEYALVLTLVAVAVALLTQWSAFTSAISKSLGRVITVLNNNS